MELLSCEKTYDEKSLKTKLILEDKILKYFPQRQGRIYIEILLYLLFNIGSKTQTNKNNSRKKNNYTWKEEITCDYLKMQQLCI